MRAVLPDGNGRKLNRKYVFLNVQIHYKDKWRTRRVRIHKDQLKIAMAKLLNDRDGTFINIRDK